MTAAEWASRITEMLVQEQEIPPFADARVELLIERLINALCRAEESGTPPPTPPGT